MRLVVYGIAAVALAAAVLPSGAGAQSPVAGDGSRGEHLYQSRCGACHSLDANRVGPRHRGIVGRRVASVSGYRYSAALQARTFVWDESRLDHWLENPTAMVPGTAMGVRVPKAQDRADIIAYLREQRAAASP